MAHVKIGPVVKRDVMTASAMLEHEEKYSVILAFDVKARLPDGSRQTFRL